MADRSEPGGAGEQAENGGEPLGRGGGRRREALRAQPPVRVHAEDRAARAVVVCVGGGARHFRIVFQSWAVLVSASDAVSATLAVKTGARC